MGAYRDNMPVTCPECGQRFSLILRIRYEGEEDDLDDDFAPERATAYVLESGSARLPCGHKVAVQRGDWELVDILDISDRTTDTVVEQPTLFPLWDDPLQPQKNMHTLAWQAPDVEEALRRTAEIVTQLEYEGKSLFLPATYEPTFEERMHPFRWRFHGENRYAECENALFDCWEGGFAPGEIIGSSDDFQVLFVPRPLPDSPDAPDAWQISQRIYVRARLSLADGALGQEQE